MKRAALILAALALVTGGCASKAEEPPETTAPVQLSGRVTAHGQTTLAGAKPSVDLEVEDDYFEPTYIKADKQATVSVKLQNKGMHSHTFTIDALRVDQMLEPGASKTVAFTLPAGVGANFYCKFHLPSGMQGAFYYVEGASFLQGSPTASESAGPSEGEPGYNY